MTPAPELTEAGICKTIQAGGMTIYYYEVGQGGPLLSLHPYGPGTTAWIIFHRARESIQHYTGHPDYAEARQKSVSMHRRYGSAVAMVTVPPLIIWGRDDRMCAFETGIGVFNSSDDSRLVLLNTCGHCRPKSIRRNTPRRGSTFYSVPEGFGHTTDCQPGRVEETEDGDRATSHHGQH